MLQTFFQIFRDDLDVVAHAEFGSFYVLKVAQPRDVRVHFADDEIEVGVSHQLRGGGGESLCLRDRGR